MNKKVLFGLAIALVLAGAIAIASYKEPILGALKISKVGTEEEKIKVTIEPNTSAPTEGSLVLEEPIVPTEPITIREAKFTWSGTPRICGLANGAHVIVIGKVKKVTMGCNKTARKNLRKAVDEAFGRIDDFETLYTEAIIEVERYLKNGSRYFVPEGPRYVVTGPINKTEIAVRVMGGKVGNVTFITEFYEPYNYNLPFEQNKKPFEVNQRLMLFLQKSNKYYFTLERSFCKGVIINDTVIGLPDNYKGMPLSEVLKIVEECKHITGPFGMEEHMRPRNKSEVLRDLKESIGDFIGMGFNKTELEKNYREQLKTFYNKTEIEIVLKEILEGVEGYMHRTMNKSEALTSLKESKKDFIEMGYNRTELEKLYRKQLEGPPFDYNRTELERVLKEILG